MRESLSGHKERLLMREGRLASRTALTVLAETTETVTRHLRALAPALGRALTLPTAEEAGARDLMQVPVEAMPWAPS
eukprot:163534-Chlamydomonas_euryale.AAC.1